MYYTVLGDDACNSDVLLKLKILNGENHFFGALSRNFVDTVLIIYPLKYFSFSQVLTTSVNLILSRKNIAIYLQLH